MFPSFIGNWLPVVWINTNPTVAQFSQAMYLNQFGYNTQAYLVTLNQSQNQVTLTFTNPQNNQTFFTYTVDPGYNYYNITSLLPQPIGTYQNVPYVSITASQLYVVRAELKITASILPKANFPLPSSQADIYPDVINI